MRYRIQCGGLRHTAENYSDTLVELCRIGRERRRESTLTVVFPWCGACGDELHVWSDLYAENLNPKLMHSRLEYKFASAY